MLTPARTPSILLVGILSFAAAAAGQTNARGASESEMILVYSTGKSAPTATQLESFAKAANFGDPLAQVNLGMIYALDKGNLHDDAQAFRWFQRAAAEETPDAMNDLGVFYFQGRGVPRDAETGLRWLRRAADMKMPAAEV